MIVGPCPCQGCGVLVWWDGYAWQERTELAYRTHRCAERKAA